MSKSRYGLGSKGKLLLPSPYRDFDENLFYSPQKNSEHDTRYVMFTINTIKNAKMDVLISDLLSNS